MVQNNKKLKTEKKLIDRGQTLEPLSLNRRVETLTFFPSSILHIHVTFSKYSLLYYCFRFLHCNVIYLAHAYYIFHFQISNCNVFVYVTLAFLMYPIVTVFIVTTFATTSVSNIP